MCTPAGRPKGDLHYPLETPNAFHRINDTPESTPLAPLIQQTDLEDMMSHPLYLSASDRRPGRQSNKIDYLLSPALWATVSAVGVERRGVWADLSALSGDGSAADAASDHAAVWVDLP